MLRPLRAFALSLVLPIIAACHTHPLPEDFSRRTTTDLVQAVRCEIAEGIAKLQDATDADLENSVVGVDFKLNMNETNSATAGKIAFADPITGGGFALDLTGSAEKDRTNERYFRIVDRFDQLKTVYSDDKCAKRSKRANFVYPIAGRIGLDEVVKTYWDVKSLSTLKPKKDFSAFSDQIVFKTKFSAGVSPEITIVSKPASFHLTNLGVDGAVIREDIHQITISLDTEAPTRDAVQPNRPPSEAPSSPRMSIQKFEAPNDSFTVDLDDEPSAGEDGAARNVIRQLDYQRRLDDLRKLQVLPVP